MITSDKLKSIIDGLKDDKPVSVTYDESTTLKIKKLAKSNTVYMSLVYEDDDKFFILWECTTKTPIDKGDSDDIIADIELELEPLSLEKDDAFIEDYLWYEELTEPQKEQIILDAKVFINNVIDYLANESVITNDDLLNMGLSKQTLELLEVDL